MKTQTINRIEREFGAIALPKKYSDELILKLTTDSMEYWDKAIIIRLIRDSSLKSHIEKRNALQTASLNNRLLKLREDDKIRAKRHLGRRPSKKSCEKCGNATYPISFRIHGKNPTVIRVKGADYCEKCDLIKRTSLKKVEDNYIQAQMTEPIHKNMIKIDLFKGCNERTQRIIKILIKDFGFNFGFFDVNLSTKLQRKDHQDIYYRGKRLSNNRLTRFLEISKEKNDE